MHTFPKRRTTDRTAEIGVNAVSVAVNDELGWIFRRTHEEHDYGIDGFIDLVNDDGGVTGQYLAVQVKCGKSYLNEKDGKLVYRGEQKHLNYLLNQNSPVVIIICDPESRICYWQAFRRDFVEPTEKAWKHLVSKKQKLNACNKADLTALFGQSADHSEELAKEKELLDAVRAHSDILYLVPRAHIETKNVDALGIFISRISSTEPLARNSLGKLSLAVSEYEDDERELWQIGKVRKWFKKARKKVDFLYLCAGASHNTLRLIATCTCRVDPQTSYVPEAVGYQIVLDPEEVVDFLEECYHSLNCATNRWDWSIELNQGRSKMFERELLPGEVYEPSE